MASLRPPRLEFPSSVDLVFKHKYPQRLDYIFWSSPEGENAITVPKSKDHTRVVPFVVTGMEFSHISDHYGIETLLEYQVCIALKMLLVCDHAH